MAKNFQLQQEYQVVRLASSRARSSSTRQSTTASTTVEQQQVGAESRTVLLQYESEHKRDCGNYSSKGSGSDVYLLFDDKDYYQQQYWAHYQLLATATSSNNCHHDTNEEVYKVSYTPQQSLIKQVYQQQSLLVVVFQVLKVEE